MVHLSLEAKQQLSALRFIPLILGSRLPSVGVGGTGSLSRSSETTSMIQTLLSCHLKWLGIGPNSMTFHAGRYPKSFSTLSMLQ